MGGNMVENLQKRGFELTVMDLNKDEVAKVIARGNATEASTPKELAENSDIVMFCLTTSAVVEKIVYGEEGVLAGIKEGSVLIDFGTSIPASTIKIGKDLAEKGAGMIDAPLGRTPAHAKDGLLNIMAAMTLLWKTSTSCASDNVTKAPRYMLPALFTRASKPPP